MAALARRAPPPGAPREIWLCLVCGRERCLPGCTGTKADRATRSTVWKWCSQELSKKSGGSSARASRNEQSAEPIRQQDGQLDLFHPLNLGRDRTGRCCAAWWAEHDERAAAGKAPQPWEDDGHHDGLPDVPAPRPRRLRADPEMVRPAAYPAPKKRGARRGGR